MPSAQNKKEPRCGSFSLRGHPYWRMEIRLQGFPCNLHPNPQPSAKRDIAASKGRHGLCLRRRTKKSRDAALFLCAGTLIGVWKYACKASRAICIRIRSPRQSGTSQRQKGGMGCAFGAEQKRAAMRLFFFARAPLLAYGNTPARLPVQSASESVALGKAGHPTGRAGACSRRMREGCGAPHSTNWRNAVGSA